MMTIPSQFTSLSITPSSYTNQQVTAYSFKVNLNAPPQDGDYLEVHIPNQIKLPNDLVCAGDNLNLDKDLPCKRLTTDDKS